MLIVFNHTGAYSPNIRLGDEYLPVVTCTNHQRSCERAMFLVVGLSFCSQGVPAQGPGMFKLIQLGPDCTGTTPPDMFNLVHYEVRLSASELFGNQLKYLA